MGLRSSARFSETIEYEYTLPEWVLKCKDVLKYSTLELNQ